MAAKVATELKESLDRKTEIIVTEREKENYENLLKVKDDISKELTVVPRIGNMSFEDYMQLEWTAKALC